MGDKINSLTTSLKYVSANAQLTLTASLPSCSVSSLAPATSLSCLPLSHNKSKQHLRSVGEGACKSRELSFSHGLLPIIPQRVLKCSKKRISEYSTLEQPKPKQPLATESKGERRTRTYTYTRCREGDTARLYLTHSMLSKRRQISQSPQASVDAHGSEADKGGMWCWERMCRVQGRAGRRRA